MKKKKQSRYQKLANYKGIRKDLKSGKYLANKTIEGKQHSKLCKTVKDAVKWRNTFHPLLGGYSLPTQNISNQFLLKKPRNYVLNGNDFGYQFSDIWNLYQKQHLATLQKSSIETILTVAKFYDELMNIKMIDINSFLIDDYLEKKKNDFIATGSQKKYNFNRELKCLKALLNWYKENYDGQFVNPILKRHQILGKIKDTPKKNKKLSREQLLLFFDSFEDLFWKDFAETQFYLAARVGEVAGLQLESLDFLDRNIMIKYVAIWSMKDKKFSYLKEEPKNGHIKYAYMNNRLFEILQRRVNLGSLQKSTFKGISSGQQLSFVFNINGEPPSYRTIQYQYNKALKLAGLNELFSSTHIMRHSMATIARRVSDLDGAQSVTGHRDVKILQEYASLPDEKNTETLKLVEDFMAK